MVTAAQVRHEGPHDVIELAAQAPLHLFKPVVQVKSQLPLLQTAVELAGGAQVSQVAPHAVIDESRTQAPAQA